MTKNILLAAAAVSAMAFAGAASAHTLTYNLTPSANINGSVPGGPNGGTGGASAPYKLAAESKVAGGTASFDIVAALSGGNFPSGNNIIEIDLSGGTFSANLASGAVTAPGCTAVLSSGGLIGGTSAAYLISSSGGTCNLANITLPIAPSAGVALVSGVNGTVVKTKLRTEAGTAIDPATTSRANLIAGGAALAANEEQLAIVTRPSAFDVKVDSAFSATAGVGALGDTFATLTLGSPVYTTFKVGAPGHVTAPESATVGQLGTIEITADVTAYKNLAKALVVVGDVQTASVTTTGDFTAFNGAGGGVTLGGVAPTTLTGVQAVHSGATITTNLVNTLVPAIVPEPFIVTRNTLATTVIPTSTYSSSVAYTLDNTFYNQEGPVVASLETIGRDGTNVVVPWLNSTSTSVGSTSNIIRLGNISTAPTGPVYAQVLNSTLTAGVATAPVTLFPNITAKGERVITTAALTAALGEFGRGDIQLSVEAPASIITARRFATLANGSTTEVANGTVASDQTPADVNDVP